MEEIARHDGRDGTYWIELYGEVYDVTAFLGRHPGGGILALGAGRHGTTLFESYHLGPGLPRARRVLPRRARHVGTLPADARPAYGDPAFFDAVRARVDAHLQERGLHHRSGGWLVAAEVLVLVALFVGAWWWRVAEGSWLAAIVGGLVMARLGFAMHSGNHAAVSRRPWINEAVGTSMDLIGGSSRVWKVEHQYSHHCYPNLPGRDNDAEIGFPLLRFHPALPRKPWHRIQTVGLAIGMSVGLVKWVITDLVYLARGRATHAPFWVSARDWAKVAVFKTAWIGMHVVAPIVLLGPLHGLLGTLLMMAVAAYYMEGIFIVNHLQRDLVPTEGAHWAEQQVMGTTNWGAGKRWTNWISGGLNHQIEHHLFPSMPVHLYPVISPVVRQACADFGLRYRDYRGYGSALAASMGYLHDLGRPAPMVEAEPVAAE